MPVKEEDEEEEPVKEEEEEELLKKEEEEEEPVKEEKEEEEPVKKEEELVKEEEEEEEEETSERGRRRRNKMITHSLTNLYNYVIAMLIFILNKYILTTSKFLTSKINENLLDYVLSVYCVIVSTHSVGSLPENFISQITWYVKCTE